MTARGDTFFLSPGTYIARDHLAEKWRWHGTAGGLHCGTYKKSVWLGGYAGMPEVFQLNRNAFDILIFKHLNITNGL